MHLNKVYVSASASQQLNMLAQRTSLRPNLSCRLGLCLSLEEFGPPTEEEFGGHGEREFNWSTLFGAWDTLYVAMVKQRLAGDGMDPELDFEEQLQRHLNRGVFLLYKRIKRLEDLGALLERAGSQVGHEVKEQP